MRRIRTKKKSKRIRIKRRGVPHRVTAVLARMRKRGESLSQAARAEHSTPRTVKKFVGEQLRRSASGVETFLPPQINPEGPRKGESRRGSKTGNPNVDHVAGSN